MTKSQRYTLLIDSPKRHHTSLWTKACQAQGWNKNDRDLRIQKISEALGRQITSTTELNNTDDIDRVFAKLRAWADDLDAVHEISHPEEHAGRARRLIYKIREVESELAGYGDEGPMGPEGVRRLVRSLCTDIANQGRSQRVEIVDVEDLSAKVIEVPTRKGRPRKIDSKLDQLLITLNRLLADYKEREREWVDDEMRLQNELDSEDDRRGQEVFTDFGADDNVPF